MASEDLDFTQVAFYGRGFPEYLSMFNMTADYLQGKRICDCPGGPATFSLRCEERGIEVSACDPLYDQTPEQLRKQIQAAAEAIIEKERKGSRFLYPDRISTSDRLTEMEAFLKDFETPPTKSKRYFAAKLPHLPFLDASFDLVLSGNLLFLYSDPESGGTMLNSPFDLDFHIAAVRELARVCAPGGEIRIYPLIGVGVR